MKKRIIGAIIASVLVVSLVGCGSKEKTASKEDVVTLKIGASPTPHAEILEHVAPALKKQGVKLDITVFDDYVLPNKALANKDIDANYFQHIPFFELAVKENNYDFVNKSKVHIELMALYSKKVKNVRDLKKGATIIASNSESDWGRILTILQDAKLVTLKEGVDPLTATFDDVAENPQDLKFKYDVNPELLAQAYQNGEGDLVAINANFANGVGLTPEKDGVLVEKDNSPYANIIAVRKADKDKQALNKLVKELHSKEIQDWIKEKWNGKVKPVND